MAFKTVSCSTPVTLSESLNYSGDSAFYRYLSGISAADSFLADNHIDKKSVNQASFYEAMAKRYLSADMHNHALWKAAYIQSENALKGNESINNTPLSEYFDMRDAYDYEKGNYKTTKYLDGEYSEDIKKLQHALNEIGIKDKFGNKLKEDGLNGPKTQRARDILFKGVSPILSYVDPLYSKKTKIGVRKGYWDELHGPIKYLPSNQLYDIDSGKRLFQIHYGKVPKHISNSKTNHINVEQFDINSDSQKLIAKYLNHKEVSDATFHLFNDFDNVERYVKICGKALTVLGYVFDAVDFGTAVYIDLKDADKKAWKNNSTFCRRYRRKLGWRRGWCKTRRHGRRGCRNLYTPGAWNRCRWIFGRL